jgi:hypothetical protein
MKLPLPIDYQQALQTPSVAFLDGALQRSQPRLTPLGLPATASGGFALTFDVTVDAVRGQVLPQAGQPIAGAIRRDRGVRPDLTVGLPR